MKEIKTRDTVKDIRTLDKAVNVADRMKNAYIRTKKQAEQTQRIDSDSPVGYAEDRATESARNVTREAGYKLHNQGKRLAEKTRQKIKEPHLQEETPESEQPAAKGESPKAQQQKAAAEAPASSHEPHVSENNPPDYSARGRDFARGSANRRTERTVSDYAEKETRPGVGTAEQGMKRSARTSEKTVKTGVRNSVKTAKHSIKTSEQTSRTTIKTTQAATKTTVKTAQATARTAQRTAQAAKAAAKAATAKTIARAVVATAKAIAAAVKSLVTAAIVVGGWVVVVVIVVILFAYILGSVFGLFASEEGYDGVPSVPEVVSQINAEFFAKIDLIIGSNPHDRLVIDNAGSASMVANWNEVLAVYDVLVATDPENPTEVATLDDAKIEKLRTVFWDMNYISYSVDETGMDEVTGKPNMETVLTITVSTSTAEDMISYYGLSAERAAQVRELLQPGYAELFHLIEPIIRAP